MSSNIRTWKHMSLSISVGGDQYKKMEDQTYFIHFLFPYDGMVLCKLLYLFYLFIFGIWLILGILANLVWSGGGQILKFMQNEYEIRIQHAKNV